MLACDEIMIIVGIRLISVRTPEQLLIFKSCQLWWMVSMLRQFIALFTFIGVDLKCIFSEF